MTKFDSFNFCPFLTADDLIIESFDQIYRGHREALNLVVPGSINKNDKVKKMRMSTKCPNLAKILRGF